MKIKSLAYHILLEMKAFLREPAAVFFALVFPAILLIIFGGAFGRYEVEGVPYVNYLIPIDISLVMANLTLMGVSVDLASKRELGITKFYKILPKSNLYFGFISSFAYTFTFVISVITITVAGYIMYPNIHFRGNVSEFLVALAIGYACFLLISIALSKINLTVKAIQFISSALFFILMFTAGIIIEESELPAYISKFIFLSPLRSVYRLLLDVWLGKSILNDKNHLFTLLAYILVAAVFINGKSLLRKNE
ncbi:ABC transporter permease [Caldisericum exile]|uniref:ABC transporter permease protein n=1 Tax=Caldisericum exile (strain DSM 21853 / NBRC 104410 / AZM16c01) TaxID=511051 RepID=A0A7U6JE13_CALEA|nr:ABC transporter permease [Caldisericum exile]BAL80241.1 putative ABC transporter permease protein [Caldisericum exile AZM16c01]